MSEAQRAFEEGLHAGLLIHLDPDGSRGILRAIANPSQVLNYLTWDDCVMTVAAKAINPRKAYLRSPARKISRALGISRNLVIDAAWRWDELTDRGREEQRALVRTHLANLDANEAIQRILSAPSLESPAPSKVLAHA